MIPKPTPTRIRKLLKDRGMTQTAAAGMIGVGANTFRRYLVADGPSKLVMPENLWELLLLKTNEHPQYVVIEREDIAKMPGYTS